ncbi:hypothetical protein GCM10011575_14770 [Microlunatus endophyticus]|uniref:Uncharacterized protein n=1 Tax=Microlunatus endophyticus TaxID=1716077 RepID=A0A917S502_9ACTN|nr:hypothetical protein [Microlunatus endophyticus]GGL57466.1 hypothetical protein GCM10011575_14770 [Microlunatus endophyticus]
MRLQFEISAADAELSDPIPADQAAALVERIRDRLTVAGLSVSVGSDEASVSPGEADWELLTPVEQEEGGFTYPELLVDGPADIAVSVFKRSVFFSSDPGFGDEQLAAAQVVTAVRALDGLVPVPADVRAELTERAAQLGMGRQWSPRSGHP